MTMALTEEEKVKVRHHLGFLNVQSVYTFVLGSPSSVETQFAIEGAMERLIPAALPELRRHLGFLDKIEEQMICGLENIDVEQLGEMKLNVKGKDRAQMQLREVYDYWANSLANLMGIYRNPFDRRKSKSMNARVRH